jgi:hypothetical protein
MEMKMNDSLSDEQNSSSKPSNRVSVRIQEKILRLKTLETKLGHLPPDEISIKELHERVLDPQFETHASQLQQQTELLFGDICDELFEAGLTPEQIADAVNAELRYPGGPKYCDALEVKDCLGIQS